MKKHFYFLLIGLFFTQCSLWEYSDPSSPIEDELPETFLSLIASDTIYASIDTVTSSTDPGSGETIYDTTWSYAIGSDPDTSMVWDTLSSAFSTITTSKQEIHWWGEDSDGEIAGYKYKWNIDTAWTSTINESGIFYVPIRTDLDVFSFEVYAIDTEGNADNTPAKIVLPIMNSSPVIDFRYRSNPLINDLHGDTSFTFPTRTFIWDLEDQDGLESVTNIYYALDDTCDTCWTSLDAASYTSITLTELEAGLHTFYLKAQDIAGAESEVVHFPDTLVTTEADYWKVVPAQGNVLLVDDFVQDTPNAAQSWYKSALDSIVGDTGYSVWEVQEELPFSSTDIKANLNYFDHVIWYSAYTGNETYFDAASSILSYVMGGGNMFLNISEMKDTSFVFFPIDSSFTLNPSGRLFSGKRLESQQSDDLDLVTSRLIAIRVKGFEPDSTQFETVKSLYKLEDTAGADGWTGSPTVCAVGQFEVGLNELSGKMVLMTLPFHNGSHPVMEGEGSATKFLDYLLTEEFVE